MALSLTVRRDSEGLSLKLLTDLTTRGLPASFWQTSWQSSELWAPLALPGFEGGRCPLEGSPSPPRGRRSLLHGGSSGSFGEPRGAPAAPAPLGWDGGLILMTMLWSALSWTCRSRTYCWGVGSRLPPAPRAGCPAQSPGASKESLGESKESPGGSKGPGGRFTREYFLRHAGPWLVEKPLRLGRG